MEKFLDRDLSWLAFNARVLQEAADPSVPLFERLRFMAIWSNNLDEFYRVRVASLASIKQLGSELRKEAGQPRKILRRIREIVHQQQETFGQLYREEIIPALQRAGIAIIGADGYTASDGPRLEALWADLVREGLAPLPFSTQDSPPFLENRQLYLLIADDSLTDLHLIKIPSPPGGRFVTLSGGGEEVRVTFIDDVIRHFLHRLLPKAAHCFAIKLSRDSDLRIDDEYEGILLEKISHALRTRDLGPPVRLLYDAAIPEALLIHLRQGLDLKRSDLIPGGRYHNFSDFFGFPFPADRPDFVFPPQPPVRHPAGADLLKHVQTRDVCLHFPYQTFDHIPELIRAGLATGRLREICINVYRTATDSVILSILESAARQGIRVTVFIEAKARFDEANNLSWGKKMEEAGVEVIYSFPGIKVHAKLLHLVFDPAGPEKPVTLVSTGNFHEKTARIYTDYALITTDADIAQDAQQVFNLFRRKILIPNLKALLISPYTLRMELDKWIRRESAKAQEGKPAEIFLKLNNLQDSRLIQSLYVAAGAGVRIRILVRGICRLIPDLPALAGRIEVRSVVGRYLEHSRAYAFGADPVLWIGSADWMTRNMDHRIEVLAPVRDPDLRSEIRMTMEALWNDPVKARRLSGDLANAYVEADRTGKSDAHTTLYSHFQKLAPSWTAKPPNHLS